MMKILQTFFTILGVIFFLILVGAGVFWFMVFGNNKSMPMPVTIPIQKNDTPTGSSVSASTDKHPLLNSEQEKTLTSIGIDPASLPTQISPEQEQCFITALGIEKVNAIKAGQVPDAMDIFKSRDCVGL